MTIKINSRIEQAQYARENYDGVLGFIGSADQDYVSARCCILNGLGSGFILASQAIEKTLKALIYLNNGKKVRGHDCFDLKEKLSKVSDYNLDLYDNVLMKLSDHFITRYHDMEPIYGTNGSDSRELIKIDNLWLYLKDLLPIPDEVKYRTKFFCDICKPNSYWNDEYWLKLNNTALDAKMPFYIEKFKQVEVTLYY